jgi:sarcosine oxidase, subunit beta
MSMNKQRAQVVIIGGGVVGNATAYYLAKKDVSVIVLEEESIGNGGSCRNGGGVRQSARDAREIPLAMYAIRNLWPTLSEELGVDTEYNQAGNIKFAKDDEAYNYYREVIRQNRETGLELVMLDRRQTKEICPEVADDVFAACFCRNDGHANPLTTTLGFYKRARELGARFITGEKVLSIKTHCGRAETVVTARGNEYEGECIIVAAGYASRALLNTVGVDIPMKHETIEIMVLEKQPIICQSMITLPKHHSWGYGHQTQHGSFVFGGETGKEAYDAIEANKGIRIGTIPLVTKWLLAYLPILAKAKILRTWSGSEDLSLDGVPVIGPIEGIPGLIVSCGFSGHGFGISPAVGLVLSEMAAGVSPSVDVAALAYDRFVVG